MTHGLLEALAEQSPPPALERLGLPPGPLALRRTWPRSERHLLLEYEAPGGLLVPGQWHHRHEAAEASLAGLAEESTALFELPAERGSVVLQRAGVDRRLPGLAPLLARPEAVLLVHQPERRAVVRIEEPGGPTFAKVVRPGRSACLAAAGAAAHELTGGHFDTPRLLGVDEAQGIVYWSGLAGVALHELAGDARLERGALVAGRALRTLHAAPADPAAPAHGPAEELAVLRRWLALLAAFDPAMSARLATIAPAVEAALVEATGPVTTIHRDFYDKQILVAESGRVGLLDFDTMAVGEPALDLANALVHLELRALQGLISVDAAVRAQTALAAGYNPGPAVWPRLGAYADATRLRLACLYSFRPRWRHCVEPMLRRLRRRVEVPQVEAGASRTRRRGRPTP